MVPISDRPGRRSLLSILASQCWRTRRPRDSGGEDELTFYGGRCNTDTLRYDITSEENQLTVAGQEIRNNSTEYVYQGISARAFERRFNLAEYPYGSSRRNPGSAAGRGFFMSNDTQLSLDTEVGNWVSLEMEKPENKAAGYPAARR